MQITISSYSNIKSIIKYINKNVLTLSRRPFFDLTKQIVIQSSLDRPNGPYKIMDSAKIRLQYAVEAFLNPYLII